MSVCLIYLLSVCVLEKVMKYQNTCVINFHYLDFLVNLSNQLIILHSNYRKNENIVTTSIQLQVTSKS